MTNKIWNPHFETMSREDMRQVQSERLRDAVERVYYNVPYYREKMQSQGLGPEHIKSVDDLSKLPFTVKQDLRDNYPFGLFAVPMSEIIRVHASSGTTGKPTVVGYTRSDIGIWSELLARTLTSGVPAKMILFRLPMAMVCLPVVWVCIMGAKRLVLRLFLFREVTPGGSCS